LLNQSNSYFDDKKIVSNFRITGQILLPFCTVMYLHFVLLVAVSMSPYLSFTGWHWHAADFGFRSWTQLDFDMLRMLAIILSDAVRAAVCDDVVVILLASSSFGACCLGSWPPRLLPLLLLLHHSMPIFEQRCPGSSSCSVPQQRSLKPAQYSHHLTQWHVAMTVAGHLRKPEFVEVRANVCT